MVKLKIKEFMMNLSKKISILCLAFIFIASMAVFCVVMASETSIKPEADIEYVKNKNYSFLNGKTGTMLFAKWNEQDTRDSQNKAWGCKIDKITFSDSISGCLALLKSGRADFIMTLDVTANYIARKNPELKSVVCNEDRDIVMILRSSDEKLRDSLNSAIKKLRSNGRIGELEKKWIAAVLDDGKAETVNIEKTPGAETVYVGVSGDIPPLDYIAADGKPAGFNMAFLAEIAKTAGVNIEVVSLDSQARFAALESKKIDVFFWTTLLADKTASPQAFDKKIVFSEAYCTFKRAFLLKK